MTLSLGLRPHLDYSIESGLDVGQEINIGSGKFGKNNKRRVLSKRGHHNFNSFLHQSRH